MGCQTSNCKHHTEDNVGMFTTVSQGTGCHINVTSGLVSKRGGAVARGRTSLGPGGGSHAGSAIAPIAVNAVLRVQPIALGRLRVVRHIGLTALNESNNETTGNNDNNYSNDNNNYARARPGYYDARRCCYTASPSPIRRQLA